MKDYILVTGGAGYIGSTTTNKLNEFGCNTIVYDNLRNGHINAIPKKSIFIKGDIGDYKKLTKLFSKYKVKAVIHFAAKILAEESMEHRKEYFENNVVKGINLLNCIIKYNIKNFVFSSSGAVYGNPKKVPIKESDQKNPVNPYGETKLIFEGILNFYKLAYDLNYISLRYFNAAGASFDGTRGEDHKNETHLIPNVLLTALKKFKKLKIYGNNFPTIDNSAVRDFIHVEDLALAHILALEKVRKKSYNGAYNLGTGKGISVFGLIKIAEDITRKKIEIEIEKQRPSDVPILIADVKKANKELKWKPKHSDINTIIETAWLWHKSHPNGYKK